MSACIKTCRRDLSSVARRSQAIMMNHSNELLFCSISGLTTASVAAVTDYALQRTAQTEDRLAAVSAILM
jgi:hypothetical protein